MRQYFLNRSTHCNIRLPYTAVLLPCLFLLSLPGISAAEIVTHSEKHVFSMNDVQSGFDGETYARNNSIICGKSDPCPNPDEIAPFNDLGATLYPVDSEFGFYVSDFVGAAQKIRDYDYAEGWVGDIFSEGELVGLAVSNAPTDTFKVKSPMGTWCAGLGGNKVKCSTEHFTVVEHIKTCYETIPYMYAGQDGTQAPLIDPATGLEIDGATCADGVLDNTLYIVENGVITETALEIGEDGYPLLTPNESSVLDDIAVSRDYSITKKDDGKPLYRFGSMIKRPNDVRIYARLPLPQEWKDNPETNYEVISAELHIEHLITNNPNDQVRPEDMENEAAIGRLPQYTDAGDIWTSTEDCYEGDGDFIPAGTVFRNKTFADTLGGEPTDPAPYSKDLLEGFTNAWYTTTDRDPFEATELSGPRWRLKPNKFGQDLPGLELPSVNCIPTPYTSQFIKYNVGEPTTTVLDLLDFDGPSPLLGSHGWIKPNGVNEIALNADGTEKKDVDGNILSVNGLPLTEDFDLAVYIKGDRKPTAVYNATLVIEYEGEGSVTPPPAEDDEYDLSLDMLRAPRKVFGGTEKNLLLYITNHGPDVAEGTLALDLRQTSTDEVIQSFDVPISPVAPGETIRMIVPWDVPVLDNEESAEWTAIIEAEYDLDPANNDARATSLIMTP